MNPKHRHLQLNTTKRKMRLDIKVMVLTLGILWGAVVLLTGLIDLIWSGYGTAFLQMLASIYPGYKAYEVVRNIMH